MPLPLRFYAGVMPFSWTEILQLELLDLAAAGHREGIDDEDILRDLVACDLATAEVLDLILGEVGTLVADDEGANLLAVFF